MYIVLVYSSILVYKVKNTLDNITMYIITALRLSNLFETMYCVKINEYNILVYLIIYKIRYSHYTPPRSAHRHIVTAR